ncbi:MAG: hypothetical protein REI78_04325 [Pedobacter sp.]|nr:hypothetical protein [Pedobacter sp.]MDQ8052225.1 hypothetical protein [Pedobacter sp.]
MVQKDKFRFLSSYTVAAYLMLATSAVGLINIFLHGVDDLADTLIAFAIVLLRYLSFVLIKRRFDLSRYLLWILLVRSAYRIMVVYHLAHAGNLYLATTILQLLLTIIALYLVYFPRKPRLR